MADNKCYVGIARSSRRLSEGLHHHIWCVAFYFPDSKRWSFEDEISTDTVAGLLVEATPKAVGFDPWNYGWWFQPHVSQNARRSWDTFCGFPVEEIRQGFRAMDAPTRLASRIADFPIRVCASGAMKPAASKGPEVALVMAIAAMLQTEEREEIGSYVRLSL